MNMFKWFFIVLFLFLSGCATKTEDINKSKSKKQTLTIAKSNEPLGKVGVIVMIGDNLRCTHTGFTVFNNEQQLYVLPTELNRTLTQRMVEHFSKLSTPLMSLKRQSISILDKDIGVSQWSNIEFSNKQNVDTVLIYSGDFKYKSKDGYYKDENALHTYANFYIYDVSSGELLAESAHYQYSLKSEFSCAKSEFPATNGMYELIKKAGFESQDALINEVFQVSKSN